MQCLADAGWDQAWSNAAGPAAGTADDDLGSDSETISIEDALNPLLQSSTERAAGLLAGITDVARPHLGIDASVLLESLFPDLWHEITSCNIDQVTPDAGAKADSVRLMKLTTGARTE